MTHIKIIKSKNLALLAAINGLLIVIYLLFNVDTRYSNFSTASKYCNTG